MSSCSGKCRSRGGECREMSGFSEIFRNFRKKVKKSEKYPPPARAGGGFFGVFGDKFSGNLGKFHEISEKSHFLTPPRGGVKNPQIWPKNPPPGGGEKSLFDILGCWSLSLLLYSPRFRSSSLSSNLSTSCIGSQLSSRPL